MASRPVVVQRLYSRAIVDRLGDDCQATIYAGSPNPALALPPSDRNGSFSGSAKGRKRQATQDANRSPLGCLLDAHGDSGRPMHLLTVLVVRLRTGGNWYPRAPSSLRIG